MDQRLALEASGVFSVAERLDVSTAWSAVGWSDGFLSQVVVSVRCRPAFDFNQVVAHN